MSPKPETVLQASIVAALRQLGVWVIVMNVTRRRGKRGVNCGEPGMPDLCLPALGWGEVKLPGNDLDPDQVAWHGKAMAGGVKTGTWHSIEEAVNDVMLWKAKKQLIQARIQGMASITPEQVWK